MSEKDILSQHLQDEAKTTLSMLRAYPENKLDLKPSDKSRSADELARVLLGGIGIFSQALGGNIDWASEMAPPATMKDLIAAFESLTAGIPAKLKSLSDEAFTGTNVMFPTGPGKMSQLPMNVVCWVALKDHIHHRGQFSVYFRIAGAKLPNIYGPTADDPWM